eukprot:154317_1
MNTLWVIITFYHLFNTIYSVNIAFDQWMTTTMDALPGIHSAAVAYESDTDIIHLIGNAEGVQGGVYPNAMSYHKFDTTTQSITLEENPSESITETIVVGGQSYVQRGDTLYFIDKDNNYINAFDIKTETITADILPGTTGTMSILGCLALYSPTSNPNDDYLIAISAMVQIYSFATSNWLDSVPQLNQGSRDALACITANDAVYAIGGNVDVSGGDAAVEYLNLNNLQNEVWMKFSQQFPGLDDTQKLIFHRVVSVCKCIVVIGGGVGSSVFSVVDHITIIDPESNTMTNGGIMPMATMWSQPVVTDQQLWVVSGFGINVGSGKTWQYHDLFPCPTESPTAMPSVTPTVMTTNPSKTPTTVTSNPSKSPTTVTTNPSKSPTTVTSSPSKTPTIDSPDDDSDYINPSNSNSDDSFDAISDKHGKMDSLNRTNQIYNGMNNEHYPITLRIKFSESTFVNICLLFGVILMVYLIVIYGFYKKNINRNENTVFDLRDL